MNILLYLPGASTSFVHFPDCKNRDPNEANAVIHQPREMPQSGYATEPYVGGVKVYKDHTRIIWLKKQNIIIRYNCIVIYTIIIV